MRIVGIPENAEGDRPFLVSVHNYVDEERLITAARELGNGEQASMVFPGFLCCCFAQTQVI